MSTNAPIIEIEQVCKDFILPTGEILHACSDISFSVNRGDSVGIVGESGSGKSTLVRMLMKLLAITSGTIRVEGMDISKMSKDEERAFRKKIQMVFQDPGAAFNSRMKVKDIICEPLYNFGLLKKGMEEKIAGDYLELVELPRIFLDRFPHEMSGGQRQRVAIARALVLQPEILVFDEATCALDVSVQDSVAKLLVRLQKERHLTYLFICHDIAFIRSICHQVMVMYRGKVVEKLDAKEINNAQHPYTKALLSAIFEVGREYHPIIYAE